MTLFEKYRPRTLDHVIGQPKAVATIGQIESRSIGGRAFWISGASGIGKTTLARIIAGMIADLFFVTEYDSADQFTQSEFDRMAQSIHLHALGKGGRAWIVNEAHGLRRALVRQLLGILERLPGHCVVIFTTTRDGEQSLFDDQIDAHPLLSRCVLLPRTNQGLAQAFAKRAREIAETEGLNDKPHAAYLRLVQRCHNNMRAVLQAVESGEMLE
jgi:replication-associated recombination protein RarA